MSGRTRTNKLCHFPASSGEARTGGGPAGGDPGGGERSGVVPGDLVTVQVEQAAPHHLLGGPVLAHRPRRVPVASCGAAPPSRPLPPGAVPLPLVG